MQSPPTWCSWLRLHPLYHKLSNSQPRLSQSLRVGAAVSVHVVAVGRPIDEDGGRLRRDVLQHSHGVPRVNCTVDKYYVVYVRVVTSVFNIGPINVLLQHLMCELGPKGILAPLFEKAKVK